MNGTGCEPEAVDGPREIERLEQKIAAGADYVMTQPAFRVEPLTALEPYRRRSSILIGVMILTSLEHARRVGQVPGVVIPASTFSRLDAFERQKDQARAGREIAVEQIAWIRQEGWSGLYLVSPGSHEPVLEVLQAGL